MSKNYKVFTDLLELLKKITKMGSEYNPIIIRSDGIKITFHTITKDGISQNYRGNSDIAMMFRSGDWVLSELDTSILMAQLSQLTTDQLHFIDLKSNGWLQVLVVPTNQYYNLKLWSYTKFQLWYKSFFNKKLRLLRSKL